jgi:type I restriction enzyme S subunit
MNADRLLAHYERIADAPNAISQLRRFVLDLAVRGKLVPQDPNDEPASKLLTRVAAEKHANSGLENKKGHVQDAANVMDSIASLPDTWEWSTLGHISLRLHYGYTASANSKLSDVRLLRITDIQDNRVEWSTVPGCVIDEENLPKYALKKGDILIARTGGTIGKTFLVSDVPTVSVFASYLIRVEPARSLFNQYIKLFCESDIYWNQLREGSRGGGQPNVNGQTLGRMSVPIPPVAEQRRIVARVDELMALCDRLEAVRAKREATRDRFTAASLAHLNAPDTDTFRDDTRFSLDALPALTARADQIKQLRQTILNLAVRGKLVPQDPSDEPASELLKRIARERGVEAGKKKARRNGLLDAVSASDNEVIPSGWVWAQLADIAIAMRYGTSVKCDYSTKGVPVLRIPNVSKGRLSLDDIKFGPLSASEASELSLRAGDLLLIRSNGSLDIVGRPAVVPSEAVGMSFAGYLVRLRTNPSTIDPNYIWLVMNSSDVRDQIERPIRSAVGLKNVNLTEFGALAFRLPSLVEQRRIVAKVDQLMAVCDRLEASLAIADATRRRLLEALLVEALTPDAERELEAAE